MRHTHGCRCTAATPSTAQHTAQVFTMWASRLAVPRSCRFDSSRSSSGLLRRTAAASSPLQHLPLSSLLCSRCTIKSRSLAPDDPFGEKSSWEDPSDGLYSAWKDVDQEGFANAAQSAEVRNAHFGPEWARFTTVGRLSVKKMREEQALQPHRPPDSSSGAATPGTEGSSAVNNDGTDGNAPVPPKRYPSAEELHEAELREKRRVLQRNYMTYEAFVEHELGAGEGFSEETTASWSADGMDAGAELYSTASMESAFSEVEGVDGRDRMAQRNVEREALDTVEAAEVEETVPLPNFIFEKSTRRDSPTSAVETATSETAAGDKTSSRTNEPGSPPANEEVEREGYTMVPPAAHTEAIPSSASAAATPITRPSQAASAASSSIPTSVVLQVVRALGTPHGDARLPLTDPLNWSTEDIIYYLTVMEQRPPDVEAAVPREVWATMDETMSDTFRMAGATGDTLLNVVVPPRLFRLMRRWHVRRQDVVNKVWKQYQANLAAGAAAPAAGEAAGDKPSSRSDDASGGLEVPADVVEAAVAQSRSKLDEAVQPLDRVLIQETILLCFPYGH